MSAICDICMEDVDWVDIAYDNGSVEICSRCWGKEKVRNRILDRQKYYDRIGHTGEDMCGCQMCARQYEIDHE